MSELTTQIEPYRLKDLAGGGTIEVVTKGNVAIPMSLQMLSSLVSVAGNRAPNTAELVMYANTVIEQNCNPYLKECWLINIRGSYVPVIAAQKRVAKAQSMPNYDGFEWGWIGKDGTRCPCGPESTVAQADISGVWGRIYFKDRKVPFYHEIFRSEYTHQKNERPITMMMKTLRDQVHKYAYADVMGNLCTENEPQEMNSTLPVPECQTPQRGNRRKPVENEADAAENLTEDLQDQVDEMVAEVITAEPVTETAYGDLVERFHDWAEGLPHLGDAPLTFLNWASNTLCVEIEEVEEDTITEAMVAHLNRELDKIIQKGL